MPISVIPLGAGQDVGRSCILTKIGSKVIMFDCGMHMGYKDERKYPDFTYISASLNPTVINNYIDLVIISHYHLDHCGALPYFTERIGYSGPIIMTYPTKSVSSVLLADCCKIMEQKFLIQKTNLDNTTSSLEGNYSSDYGFFTIADVWSCMEKVKVIQLHQTLTISGIKITPYYAGHVLGAAIFHIQVDDETVVYTGDFNMVRDRHLGPAILPKLSPDLLLSESTYATYIRPSRRSTERTFCEMILSCLKKGGKVLIPVFAIGRAQELCILLEIFWRRMQLRYPIFFGGSMTEKANSYYQLFTNWTNTPLAENMFSFPHVLPYDKALLSSSGPAVLFATPGMLHTGLSLQAFKIWAPDPNNLIIIPGFCVPGTIGAKIISGSKRIFIDQKDPSTCIEVRCGVKYLSFSSHADSIGIQSLISYLDPKSVAFIHGERQGMLNLASFINSELEIPTFCPHNGSFITIPTKIKTEYYSHLFIKHLLTNSNPFQKNLFLKTFLPELEKNILNEKLKYSSLLKDSKNESATNCFKKYFNIKENLESKIYSILIFLFKSQIYFYSSIIIKSELYDFIRKKAINTSLQILNIKSSKSSSNINVSNCTQFKSKKLLKNKYKENYFEKCAFNLSFFFEVKDIEFYKVLTALNKLNYQKEEINCIDTEIKRENLVYDSLEKFNIIKKKMTIFFEHEDFKIEYKSLIVHFKVNVHQINTIKNMLSKTNSYNYNYENIRIQKLTIFWSYIDQKKSEIINFINYIENNVN